MATDALKKFFDSVENFFMMQDSMMLLKEVYVKLAKKYAI